MEWWDWLEDNYESVKGVIRRQGLRSGVRFHDLEDFTSRVVIRAMNVQPKSVKSRWSLLKTIARHQAQDDARRDGARPKTVHDDIEHHFITTDPYKRLEFLDQIKSLGKREGRSVLGQALGFRDRELIDKNQTESSVSQRRKRAKEKLRG